MKLLLTKGRAGLTNVGAICGKICRPTHTIKIRGQMTVFFQFLSYNFNINFVYSSAYFPTGCSEMFSLFLLIGNFYVGNVWHTCGGVFGRTCSNIPQPCPDKRLIVTVASAANRFRHQNILVAIETPIRPILINLHTHYFVKAATVIRVSHTTAKQTVNNLALTPRLQLTV